MHPGVDKKLCVAGDRVGYPGCLWDVHDEDDGFSKKHHRKLHARIDTSLTCEPAHGTATSSAPRRTAPRSVCLARSVDEGLVPADVGEEARPEHEHTTGDVRWSAYISSVYYNSHDLVLTISVNERVAVYGGLVGKSEVEPIESDHIVGHD